MTDFSFKLNCSSITRWEKVGELSNKVCGSAAVYTLEPQTSQWFLINGRSKQNSFICLSTAFCGENKAQNYFLFLSLSSFTFASCCKAFKAIICLPLCFTPSLKSHWDWFVSALSPGWFSSFCKIFFTRIYSAFQRWFCLWLRHIEKMKNVMLMCVMYQKEITCSLFLGVDPDVMERGCSVPWNEKINAALVLARA